MVLVVDCCKSTTFYYHTFHSCVMRPHTSHISTLKLPSSVVILKPTLVGAYLYNHEQQYSRNRHIITTIIRILNSLL